MKCVRVDRVEIPQAPVSHVVTVSIKFVAVVDPVGIERQSGIGRLRGEPKLLGF